MLRVGCTIVDCQLKGRGVETSDRSEMV